LPATDRDEESDGGTGGHGGTTGGLGGIAGGHGGMVRGPGMLRLGLVAFGLYQLAIGLFQAVAPGAFFDAVGPFGARNDHYILDSATFELPLGAMLLLAVRLQSWRVPALAFATAHWALHALNHLVDVGEADPGWVGVFDLVALTLGTAILAWLLANALRAERWSGGP
jgi:hypothetical protein